MRFRDFGKGVYPRSSKPAAGSNISKTASVISGLQKRRGIQPGSEDWFRLWFSKPYLTGEKPVK
jgi:hypothetical protein